MSAKNGHGQNDKKRGRPNGPSRQDNRPAVRASGKPIEKPASLPMIPEDDAIHDEPVAHDGLSDSGHADDATSPGDIPDDRRIRKNGTPVPLVVQKLAAIVEYADIKLIRLESPDGGDIGQNRLYHWRMKAGQPSIPAIVRLANYLDISLEYLIDDNLPLVTPAPRKWESSTFKVLDAAKSLGLDIENVEQYLMVVKLAVTLGVDPSRAMKMIATGSVERRDYLDGGMGSGGGVARPGGGPRPSQSGPYSHIEGQTEGEKRAEREATEREDRRRRGG